MIRSNDPWIRKIREKFYIRLFDCQLNKNVSNAAVIEILYSLLATSGFATIKCRVVISNGGGI